MENSVVPEWIAFAGGQCVARGEPTEVARAAKAFADSHSDSSILVLDAHSSRMVVLDLHRPLKFVLAEVPGEIEHIQTRTLAVPEASQAEAKRGPGRPKLGVTAREVTLLPRHWDWLATRPGGASVVLRRLVESAMRVSLDGDAMRQKQESAYRFMYAMAGNEPGFEEASRALFAHNRAGVRDHSAKWPADVRKHLLNLLE